MAIEPPPPDPERERLLALLGFSQRRVIRTGEKLNAAQEDHAKAVAQWMADQQALRAYDQAHPPAQADLLKALGL